MLLLIDVGNTNITLGICDEKAIRTQWRLTTGHNRTVDEMGMNLAGMLENGGYRRADIDDVIISTVVPKLTYPLTRAVSKYIGMESKIVSREMEMGLKLLKPATRELGADRLVCCAAAYSIFGGPSIVIDYGTATTLDVIDKHGEFVTGITAPGVRISADALFEKAALLGEIELALPPSINAQNTVESLQCGILYGAIGLTEYIVDRLKKELSIPGAIIVGTGGLVRTIASGTRVFHHVEPMLVLEGLRIVYNMNFGKE